MKKLLIIACAFFCLHAQAQFGKDLLNKVKNLTKQKAKTKVDQKVDQGTDSVVNTPEKVINNQLQKLKNKKTTKQQSNTAPSNTDSTQIKNVPSSPSALKTSSYNYKINIAKKIKCDKGKQMVQDLVQATPGVASASIAIKYRKFT